MPDPAQAGFCASAGATLGDAATLFLELLRRAGDGAVGAVHAAIARLGLVQRMAGAALVQVLAGIRRHAFHLPVPTGGTGESGFEDQRRFRHARILPGSMDGWVW